MEILKCDNVVVFEISPFSPLNRYFSKSTAAGASGWIGSGDDLQPRGFRMDRIRVGGPFLKITDALFFDLSDFIFSFRLSLARDGSRQGDPGPLPAA